MSGFAVNANIPQDNGPPQHRVHSPNEPLPGSRTDLQPSEAQHPEKSLSHEEVTQRAQGRNAFNSERPLDVRPTHTGRCRMPF